MNQAYVVLKVVLVLLSVICVWFSPAPFTPAVFLSFFLLLIAGVLGSTGSVFIAIVLLGFNSLAIALSPIEILGGSLKWALVAVSCYLVGFAGLALGIRNKWIRNGVI